MTPDDLDFYADAVRAILRGTRGQERATIVRSLEDLGLTKDEAVEVIAHGIAREFFAEVMLFGKPHLCTRIGK
jgi:hypothetical protein